MSNNDMVDISVEVEALNLDGIKQNLLDYVQKKAKISIENSVKQAGKSAQDADSSAEVAENAAVSATASARQASESLGLYYTKTQTDALLADKQNILTFDSMPATESINPVTSGGVYIALSGKQDTANLVTSLSSASTDSQYPSAKCVYDIIGNVETLLSEV
ncbi:MAG: hypothetical protein IJ532_03640 [Alphaproteobacteria bacterium]|nr:hypothetical protein [Alphaproteobacteria bacterium]